jgi:hypothetical protein
MACLLSLLGLLCFFICCYIIMADTVTMRATLKVDNDVKGDFILSPLGSNYNDDLAKPFVIKYEGNFYGSDSFECKYFEGVTINFNVDKNGVTKPFTVGKETTDAYKGDNYVRIKCGETSNFYNVSESVVSEVDSNNTSIIGTEDVVLMNNKDGKESELQSAQATGLQTNKVSNWSKLRNSLSAVKKNNNVVFDDIMTASNTDNKIGGKRSRKSGRKASRKASRTAYRKPSRKLGRKSVANKKRNRGTRKK